MLLRERKKFPTQFKVIVIVFYQGCFFAYTKDMSLVYYKNGVHCLYDLHILQCNPAIFQSSMSYSSFLSILNYPLLFNSS